MKRDFIYARQSRDKKDSISIEAQIENCKRYADQNAEVLFDKGFSGKNTDRPNMQKLLDNVKAGNVKRIVVYKLDRISRNILDFANLLDLFTANDVSFVSTQEQFDTSTPIGRAMVYIIMVFAQMERETIAQRIKDNYDYRAKTGQYFMGGNVPFGYRVEKSTVNGKKASVIVPGENADILSHIFESYIESGNLAGIAKELNQKGIKTATGKTFVSNSIRRILSNMTPVVADEKMYDYLLSKGYTIGSDKEDFDGEHGLFVSLKSKDKNILVDASNSLCVVGAHDPIIQSDVFLKADARLALNPEYKSSKRSQKSFLAGLIKCSECGYSIGLKTTSRAGKEYAYYYCRGKSSRGVCDNSIWIKKEELENLVITDAKQYLNRKYQGHHEDASAFQNDELKMEDLKLQIDNLINNLGKGNAVVDQVITEKITSLSNQLEEIRTEKNKRLISGATMIAEQFALIDGMDIVGKTNIVRKAIGRIEIDKDENVKIHYLI